MTYDDPEFAALWETVAALQSPEEVKRFLVDLCTPSELGSMAERWRIAKLLDAGELSYRQIAAKVGASTTTVARVARFLRDEPWGGYRLMIDRNRERAT